MIYFSASNLQMKSILSPVACEVNANPETGEVLDDITSVVHSPDGLRQLVNLPAGSADAELGILLLQVHLYRYLETTRNWKVLGADIRKSSADLKEKIRQGKMLKRNTSCLFYP